jgi:hypothetical protein
MIAWHVNKVKSSKVQSSPQTPTPAINNQKCQLFCLGAKVPGETPYLKRPEWDGDEVFVEEGGDEEGHSGRQSAWSSSPYWWECTGDGRPNGGQVSSMSSRRCQCLIKRSEFRVDVFLTTINNLVNYHVNSTNPGKSLQIQIQSKEFKSVDFNSFILR